MKFLALLVVTLVLVLAAASALGAPSVKAGRDLFRTKCKTCHQGGSPGKDISPATKTQLQWRRFFKKDMHRQKPEVWNALSEEEKESLWRYFYGSALDAGKPETCG